MRWCCNHEKTLHTASSFVALLLLAISIVASKFLASCCCNSVVIKLVSATSDKFCALFAVTRALRSAAFPSSVSDKEGKTGSSGRSGTKISSTSVFWCTLYNWSSSSFFFLLTFSIWYCSVPSFHFNIFLSGVTSIRLLQNLFCGGFHFFFLSHLVTLCLLLFPSFSACLILCREKYFIWAYRSGTNSMENGA